VGDIRSRVGLRRGQSVVPQAQLPDASVLFSVYCHGMAGSHARTAAADAGAQDQLRQATGLPVTDVVPMDQVVWAQTGRLWQFNCS
jgi:hypothetical protein